uniref:Uncharacterized protein n=1 Tax=Sphenodon punctatus TaxID=8508 RepID=A0A8D0G1T1_SPHPU
MVGKHLGARKEHPGLKNKENDENSGPTTTVFVGNISEKASDMLIRQLLALLDFVSTKNQNPHYEHSDCCMTSRLARRSCYGKQRKGTRGQNLQLMMMKHWMRKQREEIS